MRRAVLAWLLLVPVAGLAVAQQEAFPPGEVVQQVACLAAPEFTYSLYLPGNYDSAKTWPILFIMDPRGRAPMALELFREGAERLGFILVSSYDTRSAQGPGTETLGDRAHQASRSALVGQSEKAFCDG